MDALYPDAQNACTDAESRARREDLIPHLAFSCRNLCAGVGALCL